MTPSEIAFAIGLTIAATAIILLMVGNMGERSFIFWKTVGLMGVAVMVTSTILGAMK